MADQDLSLHAEIKVQLARIEGQIGNLTTKLDLSSDAIRQLIQAGDATSAQAIGYLRNEVERAHERIDEAEDSREKAMESAAAARKELRTDVDGLLQWKANLTGRLAVVAAFAATAGGTGGVVLAKVLKL